MYKLKKKLWLFFSQNLALNEEASTSQQLGSILIIH